MADLPSLRRHSIAQVALGLFVVSQLVFLATANLLAFFPHGAASEGELSDSRNSAGSAGNTGPIQAVIDVVGEAADRWGFLTGQVQAWWLFAPDFPTKATFPLVELGWDDTPAASTSGPNSLPRVLLRSSLEPRDPHAYFKAPGSGDRLFHYESRLGLIMLCWDKDVTTRFPNEWREAVEDRVRRQWKSIRAYLRWRTLQFHEQYPELPLPSEAVLRIRVFKTPSPGHPIEWDGPYDLPLARWKLKADSAPDRLPIEMFDPIANRFVTLQEKG